MTYKVVILSANASNLVSCIRAILEHEPNLPPDHIVVVDDGARAEAEGQLPPVHWVSGLKPFIFARNANLGFNAANSDVILLNDDARLLTPSGFTLLAEEVRRRPALGICSAGIRGVVGNPNQVANGRGRFRVEGRTLAFVCVYIPKATYERLGPLDEQFSGYGFEDTDYCTRCRTAGLLLGVRDACVVDHSGALPSTFRMRPDFESLFRHNRLKYQEKWRKRPALRTVMNQMPIKNDGDRRVDFLYLACNRLEFTRETFDTMLANTDWQYVRELVVYDDGSSDGTREWLAENIGRCPAPARFVKTAFGSPVTAFTHFIESSAAPILAKTDNDAMLPRGWLRQSLEVLDHHPELTLLGIEAMYPCIDDVNLRRSYASAQFISGLGLYRRAVFANSRPQARGKWFGLEEWQMRPRSRLTCGWINPALPVFLLDRFPHSPWKDYSDEYIRRGWQRQWPRYDPACTLWHWRWPQLSTPELNPPPQPAVVNGSARFLCAMRVKNEAQHIHEVLSRALMLCERAMIFDDHSTDETVSICKSFGERVTVFPSPFNGFDEVRDKNFLLAKIIEAAPEWVLWIDGDEVLEQSGPEKLRRAANQAVNVAAYSLRIAYLWDDPRQVRIDGIFGTFVRTSFFRLTGQPVERLGFTQTGSGGNLHCGNIPKGLSGVTRDIDVRLKHYGYLTREQRLSKHRFYTSIDPNNTLEDNYRHLVETPGARHAPGPPRFIPWSE